MLDHLPLYAQLSEAGQRRLIDAIALSECKTSQVILRPGQPASGAYLVIAGRLRVYHISADGNEATLYWIEAGETCVLALNCLFNDFLYPAWVQAECASRVAVIPGAAYRALFADESAIQELTVRTLATLTFRLMSELQQIHALGNRERLAHLLLLRASTEGEISLTQQQLASHLGTRREVVARLMLEFAEQGLLITGRGRVRLLDTERLRAVSLITTKEADQ